MNEIGCIAIGMIVSLALGVLALRAVLRSDASGRSFLAGIIRGFAASSGAGAVVVAHDDGARVVRLEAIATAIERGDLAR